MQATYFCIPEDRDTAGAEIFDISFSLPKDNSAQAAALTLILITGALCAAVRVLIGVIGGLVVKKNRLASGSMMIAGGILNVFSDFDLIVFALLTVGGIWRL